MGKPTAPFVVHELVRDGLAGQDPSILAGQCLTLVTHGGEIPAWSARSRPTWCSQASRLSHRRALDNRIGCYVALEAARLVAEAGGAGGDVAAVAAVQEETTFAGSRTTAFSLAPDLAVAVDVTFATDQPGVELGELTRHPLGSGPSLTPGSTIHPRMFELLYETAEAEGISFTVASTGRGTGTDADAIHLSRAGIPTALVSVLLRYMHSPVELCA